MGSAVINQLVMMTGESNVNPFYLESQLALTLVIWFYFCLTVLMTQIVFMNVLIAIIADTFDRVWEQRQTYILSSQADILQDWLNVIPPDDIKNRPTLYMYIVEPTFMQDTDNWEGKI